MEQAGMRAKTLDRFRVVRNSFMGLDNKLAWAIDAGPEDSLAIRETGQFFGVKQAARRMNFTRQLRGVVVVETEEYTRTHAKDGCSHMGRKLLPKLLAGGYTDTVFASLRDEREHIGT